jgi:hypothetical protein
MLCFNFIMLFLFPFLVVLFIPLQTIASIVSSFFNSVVVRSCAELLFVHLQCYYNSLVFLCTLFFPLSTFNFIVLFFNFIMLFLVPFWHCCSFLSKLHCFYCLFLFQFLLLFIPVQSYYLFLFSVATIHSSSALFLAFIRQYCCSL